MYISVITNTHSGQVSEHSVSEINAVIARLYERCFGIVAVTSLLDPVEHLALHAVLHLAATQHQVEHLVDGALRVFLPTQTRTQQLHAG